MTAQSLDIASFLLKKMHRSQLPVYIFIFLQFLLTELFWKAYAGLPFDSICYVFRPTRAHEGTLGKPFGLVWCTVCTLVFCYWIMTDNRPPLWVNISMFELRKLWTLVRIRIREVFEETLGVRSQAVVVVVYWQGVQQWARSTVLRCKATYYVCKLTQKQ